ncbi:MAG: hypothetical protein JXA22_06690 [Candidatus Thermoplasmatota archaeon]|nr:hypothetical protein [Candidatus Thermoplasmatota archaeon]
MSEKSRSRQRDLLGILVVVAIVFILIIVLVYPREDQGGDGDEMRKGPWRDLDHFKRSISEVHFFDYTEVDGTKKLGEVTGPEDSVYLLIGIETQMNSSELVDIGNYLDRGGHVIVADDGTNGQRLADYLIGKAGGKVNFTGHRYLVDRLFSDPEGDRGFVYNMSFIKGDSFDIQGTRYELLFHSPNGLSFTGPGRPISWTTKQLTVVDLNDNWQMDLEGDNYIPNGRIMIEYDIGATDGKVTYISTTGLFTDNVFDRYQNEEFIRAYLYTLIPSGGRIMLDTSKQWERYSPHVAVLPD